MENYKFYESKFARYFYGPLVFIVFYLGVASLAYKYAVSGEPNVLASFLLIPGFIAFLIAKISVIRAGRWFSFGASAADRMSRQMKICYYGEYALMICGFFLAFSH